MKPRSAVVSLLTLIAVCAANPAPGRAQDLVSRDEISRTLVIRDLKVTDEMVSGVLVNKTLLPLAEVRLLIRHTFLWKKERAPEAGSDNPGRAVFFNVPGEIPPAGVVAFSYRPDPPLPQRKDGRFQTTVEVVGFAIAAPEGEETEEPPAE